MKNPNICGLLYIFRKIPRNFAKNTFQKALTIVPAFFTGASPALSRQSFNTSWAVRGRACAATCGRPSEPWTRLLGAAMRQGFPAKMELPTRMLYNLYMVIYGYSLLKNQLTQMKKNGSRSRDKIRGLKQLIVTWRTVPRSASTEISTLTPNLATWETGFEGMVSGNMLSGNYWLVVSSVSWQREVHSPVPCDQFDTWKLQNVTDSFTGGFKFSTYLGWWLPNDFQSFLNGLLGSYPTFHVSKSQFSRV